jgi:aspartate/methionine/tyrosine aminotransferase
MKRVRITRRKSRPLESGYMEWSKAQGPVKYNLAVSGVPPADVSALNPSVEDFTMSSINPNGWPPLIERIAKRYRVESDWVALAHGTSMANHLALAALVDPGDTVLVESPTYEPHRIVPEYLGCKVRAFQRRPEEAYRLDFRAIKRALTRQTRLIIVSNLHNPSGAVITRTELEELAALAEKRDIRVLVGEVYLDWVDGQVDTPRSAINMSPRFVTTNSLTKVYGFSPLRSGWVLAEPPLAARMRRLTGLFTNTIAHPTERLAARALDKAASLLEQGRARVDRNRLIVADFIAAQPRLSWAPPQGGPIGFVRLEGGNVNELVERLESQYDTLVAPGRFFDMPDYFRIGFGMDTPQLEGGLERLDAALKE